MLNNKSQEFSKAYEDFADAIFRHCYFRVFDREKARDLMQETFIKVWRYLTVNDIDNLRAFLYKTANNLIIDESRKKKEASLEKLQEEGFEPGFEDKPRLEHKIEAERIKKLMGRLDEKYRDVVLMRYIDDLKPEEIAEVIGESANNVSVRLNRGIKKIREILENEQTI